MLSYMLQEALNLEQDFIKWELTSIIQKLSQINTF